MARYAQIAVRRCDSRERARAAVNREYVAPYINALTHMPTQEFHRDLILNLDESDFTSRPSKSAQNIVSFVAMLRSSRGFSNHQDANHVILVGAVTLSGNALIPLLLLTRVHFPTEMASSHIAGDFRDFHTVEGYLTGPAMGYWVKTILLPDAKVIRGRLQCQITVVLVLDGLRSHITKYPRKVFQNQEIHVIELPAHTSHLYQPVDLYIFGITKKEYQIFGMINMELQEKLSKRIEKIRKA